MVVVIYLKKTSNCELSEQHLDKKVKSKSIGQFPHNEGIGLKEQSLLETQTIETTVLHLY